jgi:hypothetical protein
MLHDFLPCRPLPLLHIAVTQLALAFLGSRLLPRHNMLHFLLLVPPGFQQVVQHCRCDMCPQGLLKHCICLLMLQC